MKSLLIILTSIFSMAASAQIRYPETRKDTITDNYHGTVVADPYRWLEDDNSEETKEWVKEEQRVTDAYLAKIPYREAVKKRLEDLFNYPKYSAPSKHGSYYYFFKNDGLQNQSVMYRQKGLNGKPEVFLDPNKLSEDGTVALGGMEFSTNDKYLGYTVAMSGSDWQKSFVMDVASGKLLADSVEYIKFSGLSWRGDEGFYYSRYPIPDSGDALKGKNEYHQVWFHKIGTPQSADQLIMEDKEHPLQNRYASITEDNRFLSVYVSEGTSGAALYSKDLTDPSWKEFKEIIPGFKTDPQIVDNDGSRLLILTNQDAPNFKLVSVDPKNPAPENWITIIPETDRKLEAVNTGGGNLFAFYLKDAATQIMQYSYKGSKIRDIELPGVGSAGGLSGKKEDKELFYSYTSFSYPPTLFKFDVNSGKSNVFRKTEFKADVDQYETKQVFFKSKDGTEVPMFITSKKGLKMDGSNPCMVYGYGGFNISLSPSFSVSNLLFMEQGGIYVQVTLRGGGEYGEKWHKAGMLDQKQNVFDDFIGAAEYLVQNKYTSPEKLAIRGGSNGGLLVGAAMTQRPDLFKVAIPQVGVMDMLRYHKFTIGWAWAVEYGSSESETSFPYLYKYSPLHNLKKGVKYPATLITTADHDDRVVPAHSFKFAATLQEMNGGQEPTLIRIESKAGHGAGKPTSKIIEEAADIWSFVMYNLGMQYVPPAATSTPLKAF